MSMTPDELGKLARETRQRLEKLNLPDTAVLICTKALARLEKVLARPPRVAIMGEINSGKTSVSDLLLGAGVLPASVVANTHVPVLMRYAEELSLDAVTQQGRHRITEDSFDELPSGLQLKRVEIGLPVDSLKHFELLDTPGGYVPGDAMPDAQVFIWCTVASRAWTESERAHWSSLPPRCWRHGWLLATHKDALAGPDEIDRVEQRLRRATAGLFRDVIFVNAAAASRPLPPGGAPAADASIGNLHALVSKWAGEVSARRAHKAERIIRRLARLTFHQLAPGPLSREAEAIFKAWQADSARLLARVEGPESMLEVAQSLLIRYTQSVDEISAGRGSVPTSFPMPQEQGRAKGGARSPAAHRYVAMICADLTALLRIKLAQRGLRDTRLAADYAAARAALAPLADLDAIFDDLSRKLEAVSTAPRDPAALQASRKAG